MSFDELARAAAYNEATNTASGTVHGFNNLEALLLGGVTAPVISAGSEPWPGGTCTAVGGTEWYLDGSPTGETASTYTPDPADIGSVLTRYDSGSTLSSGGLTIERCRGFTRGASTSRLAVSTNVSKPNGNQGYIVFEAIISGGDSSWRPVLTWVPRTTTAAWRRGILLRIDVANGNYNVLTYEGAFSTSSNTNLLPSSTVTMDGVTRILGLLTWDSTDVYAYYGLPGGSATSATTTKPWGSNLSSATNQAAAMQAQAISATDSNVTVFTEGSMAVVAGTATLSASDFDDLLAAGSLEDAGFFSLGALSLGIDPSSSVSEGDAAATSTPNSDFLAPSGNAWFAEDFAIGSPTDLAVGGLNQPTTADV